MAEDIYLNNWDSILCQSHKNFTIYIFDDCSDNNPMDSLEKRYTSNPRIKILVRKKRLGYAKNFLYGLREVQSNYDYYAFCDQDDIWDPDKLEIAITALQNFRNIDKPSLYFSRTEAVREDGKSHVTLSQNYKRPPSFANALVQNMGGGNTMVFNSEARTLINKHSLNMDIISHDWMMYLFVSAVGGGGSILISDQHSNIVNMKTMKLEQIMLARLQFSGEPQR